MQLMTSFEERGLPPGGSRERRKATSKSASQDMLVLHAVADASGLTDLHAERVRAWAEAARRTYPNGVIVMAATRAEVPSKRMDLLRSLRDQIAPSYFVRERVRYSVDPLPSWTAEPVVALKVISSAQAELEVRSICSLLSDAKVAGGVPCSNAS